MSIIKCPECDKEVSDTAKTCPNCGYQLVDKVAKTLDTLGIVGGILLFLGCIVCFLFSMYLGITMQFFGVIIFLFFLKERKWWLWLLLVFDVLFLIFN